MLSIEEAGDYLDQVALKLPKEIYKDLNGGIILSPDIKYHPESSCEYLYVMGVYTKDKFLGRSITIFYGSIQAVCGFMDEEYIKNKLKSVLLHEFTHHLESLAGEKDLEIEDAIEMENYRNRYKQI